MVESLNIAKNVGKISGLKEKLMRRYTVQFERMKPSKDGRAPDWTNFRDIKIRDGNKEFGFMKMKEILANVKGECILLSGQSGIGKSTMLQKLCLEIISKTYLAYDIIIYLVPYICLDEFGTDIFNDFSECLKVNMKEESHFDIYDRLYALREYSTLIIVDPTIRLSKDPLFISYGDINTFFRFVNFVRGCKATVLITDRITHDYKNGILFGQNEDAIAFFEGNHYVLANRV